MQEYLQEQGLPFDIRHDFEACLREASVIYMTRIQRERFKNHEEDIYKQAKAKYALNIDHLNLLKADAFILHPLPINEDPLDPPPEICPTLGVLAFMGDKQCAWGRQSHRNLMVRYALLDLIEYGLQQLPEYEHSIRPK